MKYGEIAAELLGRIRSRHPLIHHITNWVVMNDTANATLALGALPVMAHAREEVEEMVGAAGALVLNPGTLFPELVEAMVMAGKRANELGVPIVYDPVGVGATRYRNETGERLLNELHIAVIRGNSGEIGALAGAGGEVKGVESVQGVADPPAVARELARRRTTVVAITGKRDILSDGTRDARSRQRPRDAEDHHGHAAAWQRPSLPSSARWNRTSSSPRHPPWPAMDWQRSARHAARRGPGSFRASLLDELYHLTPALVEKGARVVDLA